MGLIYFAVWLQQHLNEEWIADVLLDNNAYQRIGPLHLIVLDVGGTGKIVLLLFMTGFFEFFTKHCAIVC